MDILYLVDRLENLIASSRRMPLMNQIIVKEADILNIIDQMRTSIPEEIKQARRIIQEKERILATAQADASTLLARAREESERSINREGLLTAAEQRSHEMLRFAQEESHQLKHEADAYAMETLRNLREHLLNVETEVSRTILSIEKGLESLEEAQGEQEITSDFPEEEDEEVQQNSGIHSLPRRASLAADTMGGPMYQQ